MPFPSCVEATSPYRGWHRYYQRHRVNLPTQKGSGDRLRRQSQCNRALEGAEPALSLLQALARAPILRFRGGPDSHAAQQEALKVWWNMTEDADARLLCLQTPLPSFWIWEFRRPIALLPTYLCDPDIGVYDMGVILPTPSPHFTDGP